MIQSLKHCRHHRRAAKESSMPIQLMLCHSSWSALCSEIVNSNEVVCVVSHFQILIFHILLNVFLSGNSLLTVRHSVGNCCNIDFTAFSSIVSIYVASHCYSHSQRLQFAIHCLLQRFLVNGLLRS